MALITRTYTFTDGTTAYGSQVDAEIANIVNTLNSLDQGSITWTNVKVTTLLPQANVAMGGFKLTGLANGSAATDSVAYGQISGVTIVTGSIIMYALKAAPSGYLYCDGSAVSRGTYATLYGVVGNTFGQGDGTTTFNLPDYRGKFLRGVNDSSGNDPDASSRTAQATGGNTGDAAGSIQADQYKSHTHTASVTDPQHSHPEHYGVGGGASNTIVGSSAGQNDAGLASVTPTSSSSTGVSVTNTASGGTESRPLNSSIYFHIKI